MPVWWHLQWGRRDSRVAAAPDDLRAAAQSPSGFVGFIKPNGNALRRGLRRRAFPLPTGIVVMLLLLPCSRTHRSGNGGKQCCSPTSNVLRRPMSTTAPSDRNKPTVMVGQVMVFFNLAEQHVQVLAAYQQRPAEPAHGRCTRPRGRVLRLLLLPWRHPRCQALRCSPPPSPCGEKPRQGPPRAGGGRGQAGQGSPHAEAEAGNRVALAASPGSRGRPAA